MRAGVARWTLTCLAVGLLACELDDGPRRAPYPIVDPRAAFPELVSFARDADREGEPSSAGGRDEEWLDSVCGGEAGGGHELSVGGSLAVNVPDPSWKAAAGPLGGRLILRAERGGQVDAWAYFEEVRGAASVRGLRSFLSRIDRELVEPPPTTRRASPVTAPAEPATPEVSPPATEPAAASPAALDAPPASTDTVKDTADTLATVAATVDDAVDEGLETFSRYLPRNGYESLPGSFTGWRWLGRCRNDPTLPLLRLARTTGTWRQNGRSDAAYMIVGSATWGGDRGVYLAILATYPPANPEAEDLAALLASFHAGHGEGDFRPGKDPEVFEDWAVTLGLEEE